MQKPKLYLFALALAGTACGGDPTSSVDATVDATTLDTALADAGADVEIDAPLLPLEPVDPFAEQPDVSHGLTNTSASLDALLENGTLRGACERFRHEPTDRNRLLCGKWLFFYESFGTSGVPRTLFDWFPEHLPNSIGVAYQHLGLIADPAMPSRPLGVAPGRNNARTPTIAFTCASCHFGRMPDGRYSVGYPNHQFDYGKMILAMMVAPSAAVGNSQFLPGQASARARERLADVLAEISAGGNNTRNSLLVVLGGIVLGGSRAVTFSEADQDFHADWLPGTMDFFIAPTAFDDGARVVSKIAPLWSIATPNELRARRLAHAHLGSAGSAASVESFCEGFVTLGGGDAAMWSQAAMAPLVDYIYSLRAPPPLTAPNADEVARGRALFDEHGCIDCHDGARGGGTRLFDFDEVGVDDALRHWTDPHLTGNSCCGITFPAGDGPTHRIRAPRLVGLGHMGRFLYNGSVPSLEALFCLDGGRPRITGRPAFGDQGHLQTCDLADGDKRALLAFLRSF